MLNWMRFVAERFPPLSHVPMILLFVISHAALHSSITQNQIPWDLWLVALGFNTLFFFKMRLYDELKDFDTDKVLHPERPLPRGLLRPQQLHHAILACLLGETALVAFAGISFLPLALLAMGYSLLMYKEFFASTWLKPRLTTYAVTHTCVILLLSLVNSSLFTGTHTPSRVSVYYALACWALFNMFEFGRKTFSPAEEKVGVASYSQVWGTWGAIALNGSQWILALLFLNLSLHLPKMLTLYFSMGSLLFFTAALRYAIAPQSPVAKQYRLISSMMILWGLGWFLVIRIGA